MSAKFIPRRLRCLEVILAIVGSATLIGVSHATAAPVKLRLRSQFGREVNKTSGGNVCMVSKEECQPGLRGSEAGGFSFPSDVAGAPSTGDIYVADTVNNRIQELTEDGTFVLMFGEHVNKTTGGNLCTEEEILVQHVECGRGEAGNAPGALRDPQALAVAPSTGNLFIAEAAFSRVQEYSPSGQFILMIGKGVNKTTGRNLCTRQEIEASGVECGKAETLAPFDTEHSGFREPAVMTAGGPNGLLYVGDVHRVQEFEEDGAWVGELREPLEAIAKETESRVTGLAVAPTGNLFLSYDPNRFSADVNNLVRLFNAAGVEVNRLDLRSQRTGASVVIRPNGIALDGAEHVAVSVTETEGTSRGFGILLGLGSSTPVSEFEIPNGGGDLAFNSSGRLYTAVTGETAGEDVLAYEPALIGELVTEQPQAETCKEVGALNAEDDVALRCTLVGVANADGVPNTEVWFSWGTTESLGHETDHQPVGGNSSQPVSADVEPLLPDETIFDKLVGVDQNVTLEEKFGGETVTFDTPPVRPRIVRSPEAQFVTPTSAVMFGSINPENAETTYKFEYGPCEQLASCPGKQTSPSRVADLYGAIGATTQTTSLTPNTRYFTRLVAENAAGDSESTVSEFTTPPVERGFATVGPASDITATTASVSATVQPSGNALTYYFEVGVSSGTATQFSVVASGSVAAGRMPVVETTALAGLQPATAYSYRITIRGSSTDSSSDIGSFSTAALPLEDRKVPEEVKFVPMPPFAFPQACRRGYVHDKHGRCVKRRKAKRRPHKSTHRRH